ncbi:MAG: metallophosphoesterase [Methanomassiliicoccales archaeon]
MQHIDVTPEIRIFNGRCAMLIRSRTLVLGDLHLGIEASLELEGMQLPRAQARETMRRIDEMVKAEPPNRIVVLGDLKHEFSRNLDQEWSQVRKMLEHLGAIAEVTVVRGNHDNYLANITSSLGLDLVDEAVVDGIHLSHGHMADPGRPLIQGHEHPSARLFDGVGGYVKLPAFLYHERAEVLVLPAFSPLASGNDVSSLLSGDVLSPGLRELDMGEALVFGCSDIGLIRLGKVKDQSKGRRRA